MFFFYSAIFLKQIYTKDTCTRSCTVISCHITPTDVCLSRIQFMGKERMCTHVFYCSGRLCFYYAFQRVKQLLSLANHYSLLIIIGSFEV